MTTLNWGILGTGAIASAFAYGLRQSTKGSLKAIGSREQQSAKAFATEYGVPHHYGSYESLLEDQEVHAIYISTPHPFHAKWAVKALEANKHVLCEKPLSRTISEAKSWILECVMFPNISTCPAVSSISTEFGALIDIDSLSSENPNLLVKTSQVVFTGT